MSVILYLDTTGSRLMLGLSREGRMLGDVALPCETHRYHSAMLVPAIEDLLWQAKLAVSDLTALAVNIGPGSFTGIRTGLVTVRIMAQFLQIPVHCFNAFDLLASEDGAETAVYLDALRGRAYHAVIRLTEAGPVYGQEPVLKTLESPPPVLAAGVRRRASQTLLPLFEGGVELIPDGASTPSRMLALITRYGDVWLRSWREVAPLYLQEPSITLRKTPSAP